MVIYSHQVRNEEVVVGMEGVGADIQIVRKIHEVGWARHSEFGTQNVM